MSRPIVPIGVYISTYGDQAAWRPLAERAMASVDRQTVSPCHYCWHHGDNLHTVRNAAAMGPDRPQWVIERGLAPDAEWLCFLDADDELDPQYIEAMAQAIDGLEGDWLLQPATLGIHPDGHEDPTPVVIPRKNLLDGNFMVISTLIRKSQFERLGGFADWPYAEDWDLWIRAWRDGAQFQAVPDAVLRVHVNPNGRNSGDRATQVRVYNQIRNQYL